ncbi:MAG: DUF58 domain-containing protein [Myxococcota bacterium]
MATEPQMWDPAVLARVRHLHLRARVLTEALLQGEHRSRLVGQAVEFAGYQEYLPGMDLRHLDWRAWGRSDKLVVKHFETETELPTTIILDLSADLATGDPGRGRRGLFQGFQKASTPGASGLPALDDGKAGFAITFAATLAYFFHLHREPVGLEIIAGEGSPFTSLPPRSGRAHLRSLFLALAAARPGGRAGLNKALTKVGGRTRRRSLVVVLTDGMEEPDEWLPSVSAFARRKTDLRFCHLYDRREWGLTMDQPSRFYSPEDGEELAVDPAAARGAMQEVATEYVEQVRKGVVQWGGAYLPVPTDGSLEDALRRCVRGAPSPPGVDPFDGFGGAAS